MNTNMSSLGSFDLSLAESHEWSGLKLPLHTTLPILTICIIVITVEASSAKYLINVDCVRSRTRCHSVTQVSVLIHGL